MSQLEDQIIEHMSGPKYKPVESGAIAKKLRVTKKDMSKFRRIIESLMTAGKVREGKKGRLQLKAGDGFVTGVVKKVSSGAGFVVPNDRPADGSDRKAHDVYISERDLHDAQSGDEVLVRLTSQRRGGGQRCGRIEKVLERASNIFVGTYLEADGQAFVRVDGTAFQADIHVGDPGAKGAQPDDKVVIEMLRFPSASRVGEAVLTEVLGKRGDPGVDTMSVVHGLGIPHDFSPDVLEDARHQAEMFDETDFGDRLDLTKETIVTVDPASARDFDDAISLRRDKRGHWQLAVHIADVAHFVPVGGALDKSAIERGTSTYLPRHVIPMLPEVISNGLASLQEGQVRYTKSVFIEFDEKGFPQGAEVANTVIKVSKRFAYEEVMPLVNAPDNYRNKVDTKVIQLVLRMHKLAMLLRRIRFSDGALQMGIPEVEIDFDKDGNITGAHERHHDESHEIIEEFMLAANVAVAQILTSKDIPFLRRTHGTPDELRLKGFQEFCAGLGYELDKFQSRKEIQSVINSVVGAPEERAVNFALLRAMKQAEYSPEEFSHYALNEDHYCHFTSPIRRYPDLTIHRLIGDLAAGKPPRMANMGELLQLGTNCSATERRAEKAERELKRIKLLRYLEDKVGEEMEAFITGVENFGMFCQGTKVPAEGLVHVSSLADDFYTYNQATRTLTGERTKAEYRLGDAVTVLIVNVDIDRRQLDLRIVSPPSKPGKRRPPVKSKSHKDKKKSFSKPKSGGGKGAGKSGDKRGGKKNENRGRKRK